MFQLSSALIDGVIWSLIWTIFVFLLIFRYTWLIEHDYPADVRKAAHIPTPTQGQRRAGIFVTIAAYVILIGYLMFSGVSAYSSTPVSFGIVFLHIWVVCIMWNFVDLLILDWLIVCTITPKCMILPGTEHCKGYKDYKFHLIGFLKGCVLMTLFGLIFAGIDFAILKFLIW